LAKVRGLNKNTPCNMGNMRRTICTTNALEISRCGLQHGFWWVSQSILTLGTCFCGNNLLHCSFSIGKGKGDTHDQFFPTVHFQSINIKATLVTHAFLRTIFFRCLFSVDKRKGNTHDPCFPENNFFPLSVNKTPIKL
jgi:hypothetical protein